MALMTCAGPTGTPARRRARAKWTTFSASLPSVRGRSGGRSGGASCILLGGQLRLGLVKQPRGLGAGDFRDIVLILEQRAERIGDHLRGDRHRVERDQTARPVDRLGDAGAFEQVLLP